MLFVTVLDASSGQVEHLVGPFDSEINAMSWIQHSVQEDLQEHPEWTKDEDATAVFLSAGDDELEGLLYQIMEVDAPETNVVDLLPAD